MEDLEIYKENKGSKELNDGYIAGHIGDSSESLNIRQSFTGLM